MNNTNNTMNTTDLGYTPDALAQRRAELLALLSQTAPEVLSDHQQINVDKLKALLGEEHTAGDEHYELSWAGKSAARREIQKTSSHTLLPDANNPAQAQHMLIEGENLEVLRVLQKSYYGKVKMIYIDPPYNTGNDSFVYPDDYSETLEQYQKRTGEKNEAGYLNKQSLWKKNSKESGQYHSAWLSMMYPRLYLARNLLRDDGVIFISIDDNEAANLKLLCDEVFGPDNGLGQLIWRKKEGGGMADDSFATEHEYIFVYRKSEAFEWTDDLKELDNKEFRNEDENGRYKLVKLAKWGNTARRADRPSMYYPLIDPEGNNNFPIAPDGSDGRWRVGRAKMTDLLNSNLVVFQKRDGVFIPYEKIYQSQIEGKKIKLRSILYDVGGTTVGTNELTGIFGKKDIFPHPKPTSLLKSFISLNTTGHDLILDFFSGSGTTAHTVMALNMDDGGERECISVQMPELLDETSEAFTLGYRTIADITRARIDKVISKLKAEYPDKAADLACAYFTLAPSNFKVWRGDVNDAQTLRDQLALFQSAEKTGQAPQAVDAQTAMLTELLLKHGLGALGVHAISKPLQVAGVTVHRVLAHDDKHMWLCFEPYTEALKDEIVRARPAQVVMLNSCFVGKDGHGADEQLSNLQLELAGLDIGLTVI